MSEKSVRVSGWKCREYVQQRKLFHNSGSNHRHPKGSTLWSEQRGDIYVVFSYGYHWPLYINWRGIWFSNVGKASRTTSKHASQANPFCPTVPLSGFEMKAIMDAGRPTPEHLVQAATKGITIPEDLIPVVVGQRIGVAA